MRESAMKAKEIRELSSEEIAQRIADEREQLRTLEFQHAVAPVENPSILREKRRLVARLKTILNQREEAANV